MLCAAVDVNVGRFLSGAQSVGKPFKFTKQECEQVPGLHKVVFACIEIGDSTWLWLISAR